MYNTPSKSNSQPNPQPSLRGEAPQVHEVEDSNQLFPWYPEQDPHSKGHLVRHIASGECFWFVSIASAINEAKRLNAGA